MSTTAANLLYLLTNSHKLPSLPQLKQIHALLITQGLQSLHLYAKLIQRYCVVSSYHQYHHKFSRQILTHFSSTPNLFLFNTLLRCTSPSQSLLLYFTAHNDGNNPYLFDEFTYLYVLGACARSAFPALREGKQIHGLVVKNGLYCSDMLIQTTLIHFYGISKDVLLSRKVFDEMTERSSVSWNAMIRSYCYQREVTMESAYAALELFKEMLGGKVEPTDITLVCVLSATAQLGMMEVGVSLHGYVEKMVCQVECDVFLGTGLVDMYSKCGCIDSGLKIFWRMRERNVLTWTAMTTGLAIHGRGKEALELLDTMKGDGVRPNEVTFTSLFSACCHAGLVDEGLQLFYSMESKFSVTPGIRHYGSVVDLLGRAGLLKEAYDFIVSIPIKGDVILWRSLLSACKVHGDLGLGEKVGKVLLGLESGPGSLGLVNTREDYVALSNVYASAQRWEDVDMLRRVMKEKGIENKPGSSSVSR